MELKKYKLGDIAQIITGFPLASEDYTTKGTRVLRGENIRKGNFHWEGNKDKYWDKPLQKADYYSLKTGDIILAMDGNVGLNRGRVKKSDLPLLLAQRVACIRANEGCSQDYLYYVISSALFRRLHRYM